MVTNMGEPFRAPASTTSSTMLNGVELVAEPDGLVTLTGPVVAPVGTVVVIELAAEELTEADTPLNRTVFSAGTGLNPVPLIATEAPGRPRSGLKSTIVTSPAEVRSVPMRLPAAS